MPRWVKWTTYICSDETKKKIWNSNRWTWIKFSCDYCWKENEEKQSHYKKKNRHFCNTKCYSNFRMYILPKEEQHAYKWWGMPEEEKLIRIEARNLLNKSIKKWTVTRKNCESCGNTKSEWHHHNYYLPLDVKWLCKKCHIQEHKIIYENPELVTNV